jgi:hypothetical protein
MHSISSFEMMTTASEEEVYEQHCVTRANEEGIFPLYHGVAT